MLKVGLIGVGDIGSYLGGLCRELTGVELVAIASRDPNKVVEYGRKSGAVAFTDYLMMFEKIQLDAVIVATPSDTHHKIVLDSIRGGLHVFCEKPMALSVMDCDEMIEAASKAKVKLMVGQVLREMPVFVKVREIIGSEVMGKPLMANLIRIEKMDLWGWYLDKTRYRSSFHEMAVHEFDFLRVLFGEVDEVKVAFVQRNGHDLDYDTPMQLNLGFKSGAVGTMTHYWKSSMTIGCGTILCEEGSLHYNWREGNWIDYRTTLGESVKLTVPEMETNNGYRRELRSFFDWILSNIPPLITAEDGRAAVELAESAYLSRQTGKPVRLPSRVNA